MFRFDLAQAVRVVNVVAPDVVDGVRVVGPDVRAVLIPAIIVRVSLAPREHGPVEVENFVGIVHLPRAFHFDVGYAQPQVLVEVCRSDIPYQPWERAKC